MKKESTHGGNRAAKHDRTVSNNTNYFDLNVLLGVVMI